MKQRILVIGGGGFIGKRLVTALASTNWAEPISASRRAHVSTVPAGATAQPLDATDTGQMCEALKDVSAVVNCVSGSTDTIVNSARALFAAAGALNQVPGVVHLSSMAVYGESVGEVDETVAIGKALSAYGAAKAEAEKIAAAYPSVVILRPGIVYGPGSSQWSERVARWLWARRLGDLGAAGDGYCNLVYVDDTVEAILRSLQRPNIQGRIFNLSLPKPPTWNEYFLLYAEALGAVPIARIGRRRLTIETKALAPPLKIAEIIAGKFMPSLGRALPPAIPPSLLTTFAQEIKMNVAAAEHALEMRWTQLDEGLRHAAAEYGSKKYQKK